MSQTYDLAIIGAGPAGYAAALSAGAAGLNVALVEAERVGGTCLHRGCIPTKALLETASVYRHVRSAKDFGVHCSQAELEFSVAQDRKNHIVETLTKGLSGLLKRRKVTVIEGWGQLTPDRKVLVNGEQQLEAKAILLAAGSKPRTIPGFEIDKDFIVTSDEVLFWPTLPEKVAVIGGGVIGCELASLLNDCGTQVTLLEAMPSILAMCDTDVAKVVEKSLSRRGVAIHAGVSNLTPEHEARALRWTDASGAEQRIDADVVIVAVGRKANTDGLFVGDTGVNVNEQGVVEVDARYRTSKEGVWAIGDLISTPQLAHVGFAEALRVVADLLGEDFAPIEYQNIPSCIYTHPEVAFAGLTEQQARDAGYDIIVKKDPYAGNGRAMIVGETEGLVKVIAEKRSDGSAGKLLGVHMAGPWVTEQLGAGYLAVNWEATPDDLAPYIQPHPSLSEVFGEVVLALTGRGLHVG